jgi:putative tryptophan/tyrosine transport system substrate-binding protein
MIRRDLLALVGSGVGWPLAARAQQPAKIPHLGVLLYSTPQTDPQMEFVRNGLRDLGYVEGRNLVVTYRYAEGKSERLPELAAELADLKPDVLLAIGGDVAPVMVKATKIIPIVFASSADPVQLGLVASLARPAGNATGVTFLQDELAAKRLEYLKQAAPRISRVAFLWNPDHLDNEHRQAQGAARILNVQLQPLEVRGSADFEGAFRAATEAGVDALYVVSSRHTALNIPRIVEFAAKNRLPLAGGWGGWAKAGAVLSYGPNVNDMTRRTAGFVDKILKGAKPADLPTQQPTTFELVINLKTAKALGLFVPSSILASADEVIE